MNLKSSGVMVSSSFEMSHRGNQVEHRLKEVLLSDAENITHNWNWWIGSE